MYLGIDLGTSNSAICGMGDGTIRLFKTDDGKDVLASAIHYRRGGRMVVGTRAQAQSEISPDSVAMGFKRLMGTSSQIDLPGAALSITPEEASTEILRALVRQAEAETGELEPLGTVITIPAAFNQMQSEATIRAARAAGIERVGLLQEPIAAAMSALEGAARKDGRFLVYDIGGGTFDLALVEASGGAVTIMAHEGINMLGGRDFDRVIMDSIVRPWLKENFELPTDLLASPEARRFLAIAKMKAEAAKIELSTRDVASLFLSEEEARLDDAAGEPVYIEIDISREQVEQLIADRIDETIRLCRKILSDNGLSHEDIDRIVFIGGPSKMPVIRERVSRELGIPADLKADPMTAVARGAAIFAESRNWGEGSSTRKSSRGQVRSSGAIEMNIVFNARSSDDKALIRVEADVADDGYLLRIWGDGGYDSGTEPFDGSARQSVSLLKIGPNRFTIELTSKDGTSPSARETIVIERAAASAAAIPATQNVSIKISKGTALDRHNALEPLVRKGTPLPAKGVEPFRLREKLDQTEGGHFDVELFNQAEGVDEPHLNLAIGAFRIDADNVLGPGQSLAAGSEILVEWEMDDNGLIRCAVTIPDLGMTFDKGFYVPEFSHENFGGEEGFRLAQSRIDEARHSAHKAGEALSGHGSTKVAELARRLDRQQELLESSDDPEVRKAVLEEALHVQQDISRLRNDPETSRQLLISEINEVEDHATELAAIFDAESLQRLNGLVQAAREQVGHGQYKKASELLEHARSIIRRMLSQQPDFVLSIFEQLANDRHSALNRARHDELVQQGRAAADGGDIDGVRHVIGEILGNRMPDAQDSATIAALSGLMR